MYIHVCVCVYLFNLDEWIIYEHLYLEHICYFLHLKQ